MAIFSGCGSDKKQKDNTEYTYYVYYLNIENNESVKEGIDTEEIEKLARNFEKIDYLIYNL